MNREEEYTCAVCIVWLILILVCLASFLFVYFANTHSGSGSF